MKTLIALLLLAATVAAYAAPLGGLGFGFIRRPGGGTTQEGGPFTFTDDAAFTFTDDAAFDFTGVVP